MVLTTLVPPQLIGKEMIVEDSSKFLHPQTAKQRKNHIVLENPIILLPAKSHHVCQQELYPTIATQPKEPIAYSTYATKI